MLTGQKYENPLQGQSSIEQKVKSAAQADDLVRIGFEPGNQLDWLFDTLSEKRNKLQVTATWKLVGHDVEGYHRVMKEVAAANELLADLFFMVNQRLAELAEQDELERFGFTFKQQEKQKQQQEQDEIAEKLSEAMRELEQKTNTAAAK